MRYAVKKEPDVFDRAKLQGFVSAFPGGYEWKLIDRALYEKSRSTPWSSDLCWNFSTYVRLPELLNDLAVVHGTGTYQKVMKQYKRAELLILDEWLLPP